MNKQKFVTALFLFCTVFTAYYYRHENILIGLFGVGVGLELGRLSLSIYTFISFLFVVIAGYEFFLCLNDYDKLNMIFLMALSDFVQEVGGKFFGKHKIGWISPSKTYEGYIVGYLLLFLINQNLYNFYEPLKLTVLFISGCIGDLYFSIVKRKHNIKDYSAFLGSHGGFLDRADSTIMAFVVNFIWRLFN